MKKILIPTDGSDLGDYAYDIAHRIAQKTGAEICALSVVTAPADVLFDKKGNVKMDGAEDLSSLLEQQEAAQEKLNKWLINKPDVKIAKVKIGHINQGIVEYIQKEQIDLVIMGTAGASGIEEWLRGSRTESVVRNSPTPVLSLKCDRSGDPIQNILLLNDFKEKRVMDLSIVKTLRSIFNADLHLLKINTPKDFEPNKTIKEEMRAFAMLNNLGDVTYHVYCDENVEKGIVNFSGETGIDFLAIGTNQRKGFGRLFKYSVSEGLVNHLWQPILTFSLKK